MKKLIFGCSLMVSGMMGAMGTMKSYSSMISGPILSDIFSSSKLDGFCVLCWFTFAAIGLFVAMAGLKKED